MNRKTVISFLVGLVGVLLVWAIIGLVQSDPKTDVSVVVVDQLSSPDNKIKSHVLLKKDIKCPGNDLCKKLEVLNAGDFAPLSQNEMCTMVFGGTQRAQVKGTLHGERINATFTLTNGCEIARWERFSWLIGGHDKI